MDVDYYMSWERGSHYTCRSRYVDARDAIADETIIVQEA